MIKTATGNKTTVLGPEHDRPLLEALKDVLRELGGQASSPTWGLVGSQEIQTATVDIDGRELVVESETYVGLSISGEQALVDEVSDLVRARLGKT
jgi:hypothetical protein